MAALTETEAAMDSGSVAWDERYHVLAFYLRPDHGSLLQLVDRIESVLAARRGFEAGATRLAHVDVQASWVPPAAVRSDGERPTVEYSAFDGVMREHLDGVPIEHVSLDRNATTGNPAWTVYAMPASRRSGEVFDATVSIALESRRVDVSEQLMTDRSLHAELAEVVIETGDAISGHAESLCPLETPRFRLYTDLPESVPFPRYLDRVNWWGETPARDPDVLVRGVYWANWYCSKIVERLDPTGEFTEWFEAVGRAVTDQPVIRFPGGSVAYVLGRIPQVLNSPSPETQELLVRLHRQLRDAGLIA